MIAKNIDSYLNKYSELVLPKILEILTVDTDKKNEEIINYQILTGGKKLRPALCFLSCQLMGGKTNDALYPAAGLEILHNYSLIIDDIIDNSYLRRNRSTVWHKFGRSIAACAAIYYAAAIFQAANKSKNPTQISEIFAQTLKTVIDGEIMDILFERDGRKKEIYIVKNRYKKISEADYFNMVGKKTATLFKTCCQVGGILADADKKTIETLGNYGYNIGLAFQIQDDILDIFGDEKSFGKKIGKDISERKGGNIVIMLALTKLKPKDREEILSIMRKPKVKAWQVKKIISMIGKTDSLNQAQKFGEKFMAQAKKNLESLPQNEWNQILQEIINFLSVRKK